MLPEDLVAHLARTEAAVGGVRPGDEKGIVWRDTAAPMRTPLALVYLHGFSADRHEVEPLVTDLGRALDANVFFTRLHGHGRDGAAMGEATVESWLDDTAEAFTIGARIGERVVLIGTSTGGTLATWAASRPEVRARLAAVVLISPNYQPADHASRLLLLPWGGLIARMVVGPERCFRAVNPEQEAHWTTCYPTSALLPMIALVERVRTMDAASITAPALVLSFPGDRVVDAAETERVVRGFTGARVQTWRMDAVRDPGGHVLAGDILSPDQTAEVEARILSFLRVSAGGGRARGASAAPRAGAFGNPRDAPLFAAVGR